MKGEAPALAFLARKKKGEDAAWLAEDSTEIFFLSELTTALADSEGWWF